MEIRVQILSFLIRLLVTGRSSESTKWLRVRISVEHATGVTNPVLNQLGSPFPKVSTRQVSLYMSSVAALITNKFQIFRRGTFIFFSPQKFQRFTRCLFLFVITYKYNKIHCLDVYITVTSLALWNHAVALLKIFLKVTLALY